MEYRVEQKYLINEKQIAYLMTCFEGIIGRDTHAPDGTYLIRSVYFDDMYDTCLRENEAGVDNREKFRIRTYNNDTDVIRLELKLKKNGFTRKRQTLVSYDEADSLIKRDCDELLQKYGWLDEGRYAMEDSFLRKKLYSQMMTRRLQPVNIVEYERTAYVDKTGNVRITFDRNIGGTHDYNTFWDNILPAVPALPAGQHVLEVKYDEVLPDVYRRIISECDLNRTAFSKYCYQRRSVMNQI